MKLDFTNVPFRHNSACANIQKWVRFKKDITVRLAYISYMLMDLKSSNYCFVSLAHL